MYFISILKEAYLLLVLYNLEVPDVDGGWSDWGLWSDCSSSCGAGTKSRHRSCTAPAPVGSGANCVGEPNSNEVCEKPKCPGKSQLYYLISVTTYNKTCSKVYQY